MTVVVLDETVFGKMHILLDQDPNYLTISPLRDIWIEGGRRSEVY